MSFPADFNRDMPTSSEGSSLKSDYGSDIFNAIMKDKTPTQTRRNSSSGNSNKSDFGIFDAMVKDRSLPTPLPTPAYVPPNKRTFAKLKKEAKKAETQQRRESTPGPSYSGPRKGKGVGKMPSASNYISKKDSDEEMNS